MAKNFKNNNVERPQGYKLALQVPAVATVADLVAWLNSNFAATLAPNYGTVYTAGTVNSAQNLNAAQMNSLFYVKCSKSPAAIEVYSNTDGEVNSMLKNAECGQFNAQFLFEPLQANVRDNPVFIAGDIKYAIKKDGRNILAGELKVGSVYLMVIDIATVTAKLVQLEITDSVVMKDVIARLEEVEAINSIRKLIADSIIVRNTWTYFNIELVPQKLKIVLYGSQVGAAIGTEIVISENLSNTVFEVELYMDNEILRIRPFINVNTGDEVFVKFTTDNKLGIKSGHNGPDRVLIISEIFL